MLQSFKKYQRTLAYFLVK